MDPNYPMPQNYGGAPVTHQPQSYNNGQPQNVREWSSGICGCCEDVAGCLYCYFCYPCFTCSLANKMNECPLGPICCHGGFLVGMRSKLRGQYGIKGTIFNDVCCMLCCGPLIAHQMYRELKSLNL